LSSAYLMIGEVSLRLAGKGGISTTSDDEPVNDEPMSLLFTSPRPPALLSIGIWVSASVFMRNVVVELKCEKSHSCFGIGI